jgi:hypothetical protein
LTVTENFSELRIFVGRIEPIFCKSQKILSIPLFSPVSEMLSCIGFGSSSKSWFLECSSELFDTGKNAGIFVPKCRQYDADQNSRIIMQIASTLTLK